ncbi:hypothetical protein PENTCL1PPCAC_14056, partial [Pristionchus entomophagus]
AYQIYSYSTTVTSCVFNGLLIYDLLVTKAQHVGPYRWLLMSFAIIDICISLVHTILMPVSEVDITMLTIDLSTPNLISLKLPKALLFNIMEQASQKV